MAVHIKINAFSLQIRIQIMDFQLLFTRVKVFETKVNSPLHLLPIALFRSYM